VFRLHVPPLRERREDLPALVRALLARFGKEKARLSPAALGAFENYGWPGNVRELANILERASILASGSVIVPEHLPASVRAPARAEPPPSDAAPPATTVLEAERRTIREALRQTGGNRTKAAQILGISRRKLFYRLKEYGGEP